MRVPIFQLDAFASARFEGLSRVGRHRLVYDSLHSLMPRGIHALAIDARAPQSR